MGSGSSLYVASLRIHSLACHHAFEWEGKRKGTLQPGCLDLGMSARGACMGSLWVPDDELGDRREESLL